MLAVPMINTIHKLLCFVRWWAGLTPVCFHDTASVCVVSTTTLLETRVEERVHTVSETQRVSLQLFLDPDLNSEGHV